MPEAGGDATLLGTLSSSTPLGRLAKTQAASVAGDTLLTVALANSLFFDVDPNGARWRIGLYLLFTIAPFAVVAPLLGPLMDRFKGGHRLMLVIAAAVRALLMLALVFYVKAWALFPLAFSMLVMSKTHAVAKSAVVPIAVPDSGDLVKSNSRLTVIGAVVGAAAAAFGVVLLAVLGTEWVLGLGVVVFAVGVGFAFKVPDALAERAYVETDASVEVRSGSMRLASVPMLFIRASVGFVTMLLAFALRGGVDPGPVGAGVEIGHRVRESLGFERLVLSSGGAPPWHFGVALLGAGIGGLVGALAVPRVRDLISESRIISLALALVSGLGALAALIRVEVIGAFVMGLGVALAAQFGKQAFDSLVQRDAPQQNLGRTFSQFESRFQLAWVFGALIPVLIVIPSRVGFMAVACAAVLVLAMYMLGRSPVPSFIEGRKSEKAGRTVPLDDSFELVNPEMPD